MRMNKIPLEIVLIRQDICGACKTPCHQKDDDNYHRDPCASCPLTPRLWGQFEKCKNFGLGDAIAKIANPIAQVIDSAIGTRISTCGGCAKRREALNKIIPDLGITPSEKP
jgi:hypothetical protein